MRFEGEARIPAGQETVWEALNDPETLRRAIPGCSALDRTGETEFTATVVASVGPVSATFKGKVELADIDRPNGYIMRGRGQGGAAGFAKGEARISLAPEEGETRLSYLADVEVGGRLGSVGGRLIKGVAEKTAEDFFARLSRIVSGAAPDEEAAAAQTGAASRAPAAPEASGEHIPLIDRVAWLAVGIALGVGATLMLG